MKRRRIIARRPPGRPTNEVRAPEHRRPTVHPNPAGSSEKTCGGVMCTRPKVRESQVREIKE